jgi:hypothetical protein
VALCETGYDDCNSDLGDGCEINLQNDINNCNACDNTCGPYANATARCDSRACALSCDSGYGNCDSDLANGCEVRLNTLSNCGGCGTICDLAHASETCATGACAMVSCDYGYANCDADGNNGCEYQLMDVPNGLVGFWSLNETSGTVAADTSGLGHNGTLTNMNGNEWTTTGVMAGALRLDGTNDYVEIGDIGADIKSISFWMKSDVMTVSTSTGAKYPTATGSPNNQWSSPTGAYSNDGNNATVSSSSTRNQDFSGFGIALPSSATINGIEVAIKYKTDCGLLANQFDSALSWNAGTSYTNTKGPNPVCSSQYTVVTLGGSTDTWGHSWTVNEINNSLRIKLSGSGRNDVLGLSSNKIYVDYVTVNVFYTAPASYKLINIDGTDQIEVLLGYIAATSFPGTTAIYVDGVAGSAITAGWHHIAITDTTGVDALTFQLGRAAAGYFDGAIDEIRAYNRVLSANDILFLSGHRGCP